MTIKEFLVLAQKCKTKPEFISLAKSNGLELRKDELDELFQKVTADGFELDEDTLEAAGGGSVYSCNPGDLL